MTNKQPVDGCIHFHEFFNTVSRLPFHPFRSASSLLSFALSLSYEKYKFTLPIFLLFCYFPILNSFDFFVSLYILFHSRFLFLFVFHAFFFPSFHFFFFFIKFIPRIFLTLICFYYEFQISRRWQDVNTSGMPNYANFGCSIIEYIFKLAYLKVFIFSKAQYLKSIDLFFFNKFAYSK